MTLWVRIIGRLFFASCSIVVFSFGTTSAKDEPTPLWAGAYAQDITPSRFPISVNGGMTDRQATSAHDPLHARCIVLKNTKIANQTDEALAIVICDSCMIPRELIDRAKKLAYTKTGILPSRILIAATHSHSCPTVAAVFQSEPDAEYCEQLVEQIARGIEQANNQAEPAQIGWGAVSQPALLFNRRWILKDDQMVDNPFGLKSDRILTNPGHANPRVKESINLIDKQLGFLSIQALDGRPISLLANYGLHYIGEVPDDVVSADYFGEFAERVARRLNATDVQPPFVGAMSNGSSADVNNVDFRRKVAPKREPFEQINYAAEMLAQDIARESQNIRYYSSVPLLVREAELIVGVRKPINIEVDEAKEKLEGKTPPLTDRSLIYARETALLAEYKTSVSIKLQTIRIGGVAIAACPCEVFTETGLHLREEALKQDESKPENPIKLAFTISLANGYNGYLPPPGQHLKGGYEAWRARSSYLTVDSEPRIQMTLLRLLRELTW